MRWIGTSFQHLWQMKLWKARGALAFSLVETIPFRIRFHLGYVSTRLKITQTTSDWICEHCSFVLSFDILIGPSSGFWLCCSTKWMWFNLKPHVAALTAGLKLLCRKEKVSSNFKSFIASKCFSLFSWIDLCFCSKPFSHQLWPPVGFIWDHQRKCDRIHLHIKLFTFLWCIIFQSLHIYTPLCVDMSPTIQTKGTKVCGYDAM